MAVCERTLALAEMDRQSAGYTKIGLLGKKHWDDPITEDPKPGSMEIWSFGNTTGDVRPMQPAPRAAPGHQPPAIRR
ncbi:MAG TPA: hypothetical protein VMF10_08325 [Candidatus Aquilonibacter sp.]|nr:hypothetical protein [Candidatus Aquilonibacter sp.]